MQRALATALVVMVLAGCSEAGPGDESVDAVPKFALRGVVVDDAVVPIAGASLRLEPGGLVGVTDDNGMFTFTDLEPRAYTLTVTAQGFLDVVQVVAIASDGSSEVAKIVLPRDADAVAYVRPYHYQGFVECAVFPINWCGQANIASIILCQGYGLCVGPVTNDRSLALHWLDAIPDFLQTEMVWSANNELGENFFFVIGAGTEEEIASGFVAAINTTRGPSPLMMQLDGPTLLEHSIGGERALMTQLHPSPQEEIPGGCVLYNPCGVSVHAMQDYEYFTHAFFGYEPPDGWLFARDGAPPGP